MIGWLVATALGLGAVAAFRGGKSGAKAKSSASSVPLIVTDDAAELDAILVEAGLSPSWRRFFLVTALGESGFVSNVYLGRPELQPPGTVLSKAWEQIGESEYQASVVSYDRNLDVFGSCPWPRERYTVAGGLFGFLAPNAVYAYRNTKLRCIDPWAIYDAVEAVVMGLDYVRRVLGNAKMSANGDWLDLRLGIKGLSTVGVAEHRSALAAKLESRKVLSSLGIPKSWLFEKVDPLPPFDLLDLRSRLLAKFRPHGQTTPHQAPAVPPARILTLGGLETLEVLTGGAALDDDVPVVVALHGRGGTPSALADVVRSMPDPFRFLLPAAPGKLGSGRAWWQASTASSTLDQMAAAMPAGADALVPMLVAVQSTYGRRPALFGHSQGAMLAYLIASQHGTLAEMVVAASGWLPPALWPAPSEFQTTFYPSIVGIHGETDSTVPLDLDVETVAAFEEAGAEVDFYAETGIGHALGPLWPLARDVLIAWGG